MSLFTDAQAREIDERLARLEAAFLHAQAMGGSYARECEEIRKEIWQATTKEEAGDGMEG